MQADAEAQSSQFGEHDVQTPLDEAKVPVGHDNTHVPLRKYAPLTHD